MKFTVIMLLTCILYSVRRARLHLELFASAVGRSRFLSRMSYFVLVYFSSGYNVALLSESDTFVDLIELMLLLLDVWVFSSCGRSGTTGFKCSCLRSRLLTVLRVLFVRLGSGNLKSFPARALTHK